MKSQDLCDVGAVVSTPWVRRVPSNQPSKQRSIDNLETDNY